MDIKGFFGEARFLSNFYPARTTYDGVAYPTSEHAYQAAKTTDKAERGRFLHADTPGKAKRLGRSITMRSDWDAVKDEVMLTVVRSKFADNPSLARRLLATGDALLEETNTWFDRYWGVCNGSGRNQLGKTLMQVRAELAARRAA